jgi:hypothetical protein
MITGIAFCPHPPVLVPELAQGAAAELAAVRTACRTAIRRIAAPDPRRPERPRLVLLGAGPTSARHEPTARGSFAGFGVALEVPLGSDDPGPVELPLSLTVGAWLVRDALGPASAALGCSIGPDARGATELLGQVTDLDSVGLVVMGDGSARRSPKAPGYFDERAEPFDAEVAAALASGEGGRLHVDVDLGDELLASGSRVWDAAASVLDAEPPFDNAELLYAEAPYGVGYFVAVWTRA